jgi:hypothetical protein
VKLPPDFFIRPETALASFADKFLQSSFFGDENSVIFSSDTGHAGRRQAFRVTPSLRILTERFHETADKMLVNT